MTGFSTPSVITLTRPNRASSLRLWAMAISGQLAAQMPQAWQASASTTASLPSSLTSWAAAASSGPLDQTDGAERASGDAHVAADALLRLHYRGGRAAAALGGEEVVDLAGHRRGLGVAFDECLGPGGGAADEDALAGGLGGAILAVEDLDEAVLVQIDVEQPGRCARRRWAGTMRRRARPSRAAARPCDRRARPRPDHGLALAVELHFGRRAAQELDPARRAARYQFS